MKRTSELKVDIVRWTELEINLIASNNDLAPKILGYNMMNGTHFSFVQEIYPVRLADIKDKERRCSLLPIIKDILLRLHILGVVHGSVSEDNIVLNRNLKEVRLIDYSKARWIRDIPADNIQEYLQSEVDTLDYICGGK